MKKKVLIIVTIIIVLLVIIGSVIGLILYNNSKEESVNLKDLTKNYTITNYKINNVSIKNVDNKTKIEFYVTNTSDETLSNDTIYISFMKDNKKIYELQGLLGEDFKPDEIRGIETTANEDLLKQGIDKIIYDTKPLTN